MLRTRNSLFCQYEQCESGIHIVRSLVLWTFSISHWLKLFIEQGWGRKALADSVLEASLALMPLHGNYQQ